MAASISEIYEDVGQIIIDSMIATLTGFSPHAVSSDSELIKSFDTKVSFNERDLKTGRFKTLSLSVFMNEYGLALDKGRQGTEGNTNIQTNWARGTVTGVPISALLKFIKRSGLQSKIRGKKGRFISLNSIAFIIQRSIKRNGITPRNFILPAFEKGQKELSLRLDRDLLNILTADLVEVYKKN